MPDQSVLEADLCIVGGGAAGITLAREFRDTRFSVLMLESGGFEFDSRTQSLYDGESSGTVLKEDSNYLTSTRLRYFGGSTNHWFGFCRPLDAIDFHRRPWVPHSGWPFSKSELVPFYRKGASICQLKNYPPDSVELRHPNATAFLLDGVDQVAHKLFYLSPPTQFGAHYRDELVQAGNVTVCLFANAIDIEANRNASRIVAIEVKTLSGTGFRVEARAFVLACGGIENARLLLDSDQTNPAGLGNENDLVGRYFTEHPHLSAGSASFIRPKRLGRVSLADLMGNSAHSLGTISLSESNQREHEVLNCGIEPRVISAPGNFAKLMRAVAAVASEINDSQVAPVFANLVVRSEQAPNPESRVRLMDDVDHLGRRRVRLEWRLGDLDRASIRRTIEVFGSILGSVGVGRARVRDILRTGWPRTQGGAHHMGTTRMHEDPKRGVVDPSARVHSIANLYIAGSSVFPTGGFANPTLTIVALSLRLADHLKTVLG